VFQLGVDESDGESLETFDSGYDGIDDGIVSVDGIDATRISGGRADLAVDAIVTSGHRNLEVDGIGKIGIAVGHMRRGFEVDSVPLTDEVHRKTDEVSVCEDSSGVSETVAVSEDDTDQLSEDGIDFPNLGRIGVETPKPLDGRISEHDRECLLDFIERPAHVNHSRSLRLAGVLCHGSTLQNGFSSSGTVPVSTLRF